MSAGDADIIMVSGSNSVHYYLALLVGDEPLLSQVTVVAGPPVDMQIKTPDVGL